MVLVTRACSRRNLREAQSEDKPLREMIQYLTTERVPALNKSKVRRFQAAAKEFSMKDGVLHRGGKIVIPQSLRNEILKEMHEGTMAAHLSADKILPTIAERFWWPAMSSDTRSYCAACVLCNRATPYASKRFGKLRPIVATGPWHTVAMDLYGPLDDGLEDERYVLVMMDHFTKYVILCALCDKRAATVARKVRKQLLCVFGVPARIITDNGTEFKGQFDELCVDVGIQHSMTLPYHQQANGLVERYMQLLNKMVRIVANEAEVVWPRRLCTLAFAYNTSYHPTIQNTPFFLNFLRDPRLPLDNILSKGESESQDRKNKFQMGRKLMDWTSRRIAEVQHDAAQRYDKKQRDFPCSPGDLVFIREESLQKKSRMKWSELHRIVSIDENRLNVTVQSLYGVDTKPFEVNVQRLRPYQDSQLNLWVQPEAPDSDREKVPSPELDPEDCEFDEGDDARHKLLLAASAVAILGNELQRSEDRQWTEPCVTATELESETGGTEGLPEVMESTGNRHWPLEEVSSLPKGLLLTSDNTEGAQPEQSVDVGERPLPERPLCLPVVEPTPIVVSDRESVEPADRSIELQDNPVSPNVSQAVLEQIDSTLGREGSRGELRSELSNGSDTYTIQDIIAHRKFRNTRKYKVLWEGYPVAQATWQFEDDFTNQQSKDLLDEYKRRKNLDAHASTSTATGSRPRRR